MPGPLRFPRMTVSPAPVAVDCCAVFRLVEACHDVVGRVEAALGDLGLSLAKVGILRQLVLADSPIPLTALAERIGCVKSNVSQLVDRLGADGLVARQPDAHDRRLVRATITPAGRAAYAQATERLGALTSQWADRIDGGPDAVIERLGELVALVERGHPT